MAWLAMESNKKASSLHLKTLREWDINNLAKQGLIGPNKLGSQITANTE